MILIMMIMMMNMIMKNKMIKTQLIFYLGTPNFVRQQIQKIPTDDGNKYVDDDVDFNENGGDSDNDAELDDDDQNCNRKIVIRVQLPMSATTKNCCLELFLCFNIHKSVRLLGKGSKVKYKKVVQGPLNP